MWDSIGVDCEGLRLMVLGEEGRLIERQRGRLTERALQLKEFEKKFSFVEWFWPLGEGEKNKFFLGSSTNFLFCFGGSGTNLCWEFCFLQIPIYRNMKILWTLNLVLCFIKSNTKTVFIVAEINYQKTILVYSTRMLLGRFIKFITNSYTTKMEYENHCLWHSTRTLLLILCWTNPYKIDL